MAELTSANTLPYIKQEQHSLPEFPPSQEAVIQAVTHGEAGPQKQEGEPQFMKSIDEIGSFASAFDAFKRRFDELQKHLDFINRAIDAKFDDNRRRQQRIKNGLAPDVPLESTETDKTGTTELTNPDPETVVKSSRTEIQHLCETMCSKGLRRYIATHLFDIPKLREEVPAALKLAPKPAKLVLECIGRFFLQGIRAYSKDSPMIPARQASVFILELFLLMMGGCDGAQVEIEQGLKEEAEMGAIAWKKRLISEGGLSKASEIDARGLLLFIGSFGIPKAFRNEEVGTLLRLCNLKELSEALKFSPGLVAKMPDIVNAMVKNGMHVNAIDIAVTFGLEDRFPPQSILTSFVRESKEAYEKARREARNSPKALKHANEKQLASLQSVVKCMEDHNIDPIKVLDGTQIREKIAKFEKEIAELNKKVEDKGIPKRKLDEMGSSSKVRNQDIKRSRFLGKEAHGNGLHGQRAVSHGDGYWTENSVGPIIGGPGLLHGAGVRGGVVAGATVLSTSSYSGPHGDIGGSKIGQIVSNSAPTFGWHGVDATYIDRSIGQSSVGQSSSMGVAGLLGRSESIDGFAVAERESYGSSHRPGTLPPTARHPTYL
ncbi:hypothetical protein SLE2022_370240 [Rubroshorea leprosula]